MNDLVDLAISAHGGWKRWQSVGTLTARASISGGLWHLKGKAGLLEDVVITASTKRQHVEYASFGHAGQHSAYEPKRTAIISDSGELIDSRDDPRSSFSGHGLATPWDDQHLIYFSGYAMWTYLTTPFLFREAGFSVEEVGPWNEEGTVWRRLKVLFPDTVPSHSTEQTFYFDESGLLRRHDYSVEVVGGTRSANYALEPREFDGLVVPTKRRVYAIGADNKPLRDRIAVSIDLHAISVK